MAAFGLYTHIQSNKRRSVILLIGLFFLVYVLVFAGALLAEVYLHGNVPLDFLLQAAKYDFLKAAPFAIVGALIWIAIAYKFHQSMIDSMTDAQAVTRQEAPELYNLLENLCISRGIPMPSLRISEEPGLNAFATGLNQKQYSITVTRGLIDALDKDEIEAVLGHELTHIRNGDVRMLVIAVVIAGVISFFGELIFRILIQGRWGGGSRSSGSSEKKGGGGIAILIALALIVLAWILSVVIRFALSRQREYLADSGSVELTKNPDAMISALRKIEGRGDIPTANSAVMEMCIDDPRTGFSSLFDTHPSVDKRVAALVQFAGGHDPGPLAIEPSSESDQTSVPSESQSPRGPWNQDVPPDRQQSEQPPAPWGQPPKPGPWGNQ
ncbi:MAG TPA: M48 family metallopeptidase [Pseudolabrys sp.]|nr:M48 family metallopeptidase [Pseudolabrys sp.]